MKPKDAAIAEILSLSDGMERFPVRRAVGHNGGVLDRNGLTVQGNTTPLAILDIRGLNVIRNQLRSYHQKLAEKI